MILGLRRDLGQALRCEQLFDHRELWLARDPGHVQRVRAVARSRRDDAVVGHVLGDASDSDEGDVRLRQGAPRDRGLEAVAGARRRFDDSGAGHLSASPETHAPLTLPGLSGVESEVVDGVCPPRLRDSQNQRDVVSPRDEAGVAHIGAHVKLCVVDHEPDAHPNLGVRPANRDRRLGHGGPLAEHAVELDGALLVDPLEPQPVGEDLGGFAPAVQSPDPVRGGVRAEGRVCLVGRGGDSSLRVAVNIPGENLNGVYSANEFLTRANLMKAYLFPEYDTPIRMARKVAVVGGGNVAMDSARVAKRLGADHVYLVYRRSRAEMPARAEEAHHAEEEGIDFRMLTNPIRIVGDDKNWVKGIECVKMDLGEPDASGRRRPVEIKGSEHIIDVEVVVVAIGQGPNPILTQSTEGLALRRSGNIEADPETGKTSRKGVFAGGDIVTGAATVILAMGAGRKAAAAIDEYLKTGQW